MPFISDSAMQQVKNEISELRAKARGKGKGSPAKTRKNALRSAIEVGGAAALAGFARGKMEKAGKSCEFMGVDLELAAAVVLVGLPLSGLKLPVKLPESSMVNAGMGLFAHYAGQVSRNYAKTDKLSFVAGNFPGTADYGQFSGNSQFSLPRKNEWDDTTVFEDNDVSGSHVGLRRAAGF